MLIVLPKEREGLDKLESSWNDYLYESTVSCLAEEEVNFSLPRFKTETKFELKHVLAKMGAGLAFGDDANFSGIGEEPLKISEVIHKAFVECDEVGTEAAAATAVGMMLCSAAFRQEPKVFNADHPFMFFIHNKEKRTILFSGRVVNFE
jgi:serpin B